MACSNAAPSPPGQVWHPCLLHHAGRGPTALEVGLDSGMPHLALRKPEYTMISLFIWGYQMLYLNLKPQIIYIKHAYPKLIKDIPGLSLPPRAPPMTA